jgi:hypothetical protein
MNSMKRRLANVGQIHLRNHRWTQMDTDWAGGVRALSGRMRLAARFTSSVFICVHLWFSFFFHHD